MEENQDFVQQLDESLRAKRSQLDESAIPVLREELRNFSNTFYTIYTYLVKKGYLKEDLYNYDQKSKMDPPSSDPINDNELIPELSFRMSSYFSVLDYVNNMYNVDTDKMTLGGIRKLLNVVNYFKWDSMGGNTSHPMTRSLTLVFDRIVTAQNDPMSSEVRFNAINTLKASQNKIKRQLKDLSIYQRELYKFKVRSIIMTEDSLTTDMVQKDRKGSLIHIKMEMTSLLPDEPFYRELIEEMLDEDYGYEVEKKRAAALARLKVAQKAKKKKAEKKVEEKKVGKADLIKILPDLSKAADQLNTALVKLEHNKNITSAKKKNLGEILRRFFTRREADIYYSIQSLDPISGQSRKENIHYNGFTGKVAKKIQLLRNLANTNSPQYGKLIESSEETIYQTIESNLMELRSFHRRMTGLDSFFKNEEDTTLRARIKGIRVETDTLKNIYMDCTKSLKEYSATKEEIAQLKALGIQE